MARQCLLRRLNDRWPEGPEGLFARRLNDPGRRPTLPPAARVRARPRHGADPRPPFGRSVLPPHACVAGPAQREAVVEKMGSLPATGSFVHSGNSHPKAPSPWGGSSRRRRVRVGPQRGKGLPTGSCRRSVTFLRSCNERSSGILKATEGSACPVATEGSACPVGTTP